MVNLTHSSPAVREFSPHSVLHMKKLSDEPSVMKMSIVFFFYFHEKRINALQANPFTDVAVGRGLR